MASSLQQLANENKNWGHAEFLFFFVFLPGLRLHDLNFQIHETKNKYMKQKSTSHGGSNTSHTRPQNTQSHNHFSFKIPPSSPPSTQIQNSFGCPLSCVKNNSHLVRKHSPPNTKSCSQFRSRISSDPVISVLHRPATPRSPPNTQSNNHHLPEPCSFWFQNPPFAQSTKTHKSHQATVYKPASKGSEGESQSMLQSQPVLQPQQRARSAPARRRSSRAGALFACEFEEVLHGCSSHIWSCNTAFFVLLSGSERPYQPPFQSPLQMARIAYRSCWE